MSRLMQVIFVVVAATLLVAPANVRAQDGEPAAKHWFKGNLHTHSLWSDGDDFPEMIASWYRDNGYHFLALSDHNVLSRGERWLNVAESKRANLNIAIKKYEAKFPNVIERRTGEKGAEIRLQPLDKVRELIEQPGKFIMIESEEVTSRFPLPAGADGKERNLPVHMNATNLAEVIPPATGASVREIIQKNFDAAEEQARRLNRPIVMHLNHPNFGWGVTAADLASVVDERYFEVYNGHPGVNNRGDASHPSTDRIWDICNTIRLAQLNAAPMFGLGTDDSHHYHTPGMNRSTSGRGWIMLRAASLTTENVMAALKAGDFYASSGVTLRDVKYDPKTKKLLIEIEPDGDATFTTRFVGTPKSFAATGATPLDSADVGKTFATVEGTSPSYTMSNDDLYVRAIVTSSAAPKVPSYENQKAQAWTQPVGWEK